MQLNDRLRYQCVVSVDRLGHVRKRTTAQGTTAALPLMWLVLHYITGAIRWVPEYTKTVVQGRNTWYIYEPVLSMTKRSQLHHMDIADVQ